LGRFSMARFLPNAKISEVHGQASWVKGRLIVAMYHPAAALHQPSLKSTVEEDFTRLPEHIQLVKNVQPARNIQPSKPIESDEPKPPPADDEPTQLTLF